MGGGVAAFDYDNNGRLIFSSPMDFSKGAMPRDASPDKNQPKYWNRLYQQKDDGTFIDVTERAA